MRSVHTPFNPTTGRLHLSLKPILPQQSILVVVCSLQCGNLTVWPFHRFIGNYMGMISQLAEYSQRNRPWEMGKYEKPRAGRNFNDPCSLEVWIILKILRKDDLCQIKGNCQMLFAMKCQSLFRCPHSSLLAELLNAESPAQCTGTAHPSP